MESIEVETFAIEMQHDEIKNNSKLPKSFAYKFLSKIFIIKFKEITDNRKFDDVIFFFNFSFVNSLFLFV